MIGVLGLGLILGLIGLFVGYRLKLVASLIVAAFIGFLLLRVPFGFGMALIELPVGVLIGGLAGVVSAKARLN